MNTLGLDYLIFFINTQMKPQILGRDIRLLLTTIVITNNSHATNFVTTILFFLFSMKRALPILRFVVKFVKYYLTLLLVAKYYLICTSNLFIIT